MEAYNQLLQQFKTTPTTSSGFDETYQKNHPAQTELVSWLQNWKTQHGVIGKRSAIERDEPLKSAPQPTAQRRKVVVRRKLIDE